MPTLLHFFFPTQLRFNAQISNLTRKIQNLIKMSDKKEMEPENKKRKLNTNPIDDISDQMADAANLSDQFRLLLGTPMWSDIVFEFPNENKKILAHKLILRTGCKVFCKMISNDWKEKDSIVITEFLYIHFKEMLIYLYTRAPTLSEENAMELLKMAHLYMLNNLENMIGDFVKTKLTIDNACKFYEESLIYDNKCTKECEKFISNHTTEIIKTKSFKCLRYETLKSFLKIQYLDVLEYKLFIGCINWSKEVCVTGKLDENSGKNQRDALNGLENLIRYPIMTPNEFSMCIKWSPMFFTKEEIGKIFLYIELPSLVPKDEQQQYSSVSRFKYKKFAWTIKHKDIKLYPTPSSSSSSLQNTPYHVMHRIANNTNHQPHQAEWLIFKTNHKILLKTITFKRYPKEYGTFFLSVSMLANSDMCKCNTIGQKTIYDKLNLLCDEGINYHIGITKKSSNHNNQLLCENVPLTIKGSYSPFSRVTLEWESSEYIMIESISFDVV